MSSEFSNRMRELLPKIIGDIDFYDESVRMFSLRPARERSRRNLHHYQEIMLGARIDCFSFKASKEWLCTETNRSLQFEDVCFSRVSDARSLRRKLRRSLLEIPRRECGSIFGQDFLNVAYPDVDVILMGGWDEVFVGYVLSSDEALISWVDDHLKSPFIELRWAQR